MSSSPDVLNLSEVTPRVALFGNTPWGIEGPEMINP